MPQKKKNMNSSKIQSKQLTMSGSAAISAMELFTSKSLSESFILTSTNPKYEKRLFIDLPVQYVKTTSSEHGENMLCTQIVFFVFVLTFKTIYAHNMFSLCSELVVFMY